MMRQFQYRSVARLMAVQARLPGRRPGSWLGVERAERRRRARLGGQAPGPAELAARNGLRPSLGRPPCVLPRLLDAQPLVVLRDVRGTHVLDDLHVQSMQDAALVGAEHQLLLLP